MNSINYLFTVLTDMKKVKINFIKFYSNYNKGGFNDTVWTIAYTKVATQILSTFINKEYIINLWKIKKLKKEGDKC